MALAPLKYLIDNGAGAEAQCATPHCRGGGALDVEGLAKRYGDQVTLDQLEPRLKCRICGRKGMTIVCFAMRHGPIG